MANPQDWMSLLKMLQQQQGAQRGMGYPGMPSMPQLPGMPIQGPQVGGGMPGAMPGGRPGGLPNFIPGRGAQPGRPWQAPLPGYNPGEQTMPAGQPPGQPPRFDNGPLTAGAKAGAGVSGGPQMFDRGPLTAGPPQGLPPAILQALMHGRQSGSEVPNGGQGPMGNMPNPSFYPGTPVNPGINPQTGQPLQQGDQQGFQAMIERLRQMYMGMPQGNQVDLMGRPIMNGGWT